MCRSLGPATLTLSAFILSSFDAVRRSDVLLAPLTLTPVSASTIIPTCALVSGLCPVFRHAPSMRAAEAGIVQPGDGRPCQCLAVVLAALPALFEAGLERLLGSLHLGLG